MKKEHNDSLVKVKRELMDVEYRHDDAKKKF